jgi:hypothetical protein
MADKRLFVKIDVDGGAAQRVFQEVGRAAQQMARTLEQAADGASDGIERIDDAATDSSQALDRLDRAQQEAAASAERVERSTTEAATALDRVDTAATDAGRALDTVDTAATDAGRAMDDTATASENAGRSLRDFSEAGAQVAQGLGLIGGAFTMYANQAREHELAVSALGRTYGDAASQFVSLANSMQSSTIFSNDQVLEAANLMGTLSRNYDLTAQQIQQLIQVSADLAAVNGISLADASQRVAAAMRGEAESAEVLGLTMNDAAIGINKLGSSATEAEKAQFRLNALLEQSAFAMGEAEAQANSTTGQVQQLANRVQDAAVNFVEMTGPVGDVAAGLGSFGVEAGLAVAGLVRLAQGIRTASLAAGGMSSILGPAALVGALGIGVVAAIKLSDAMRSDLSKSMEETSRQGAELETIINSLASSMDNAAMAIDIKEALDDINQVDAMIKGVDAALKDLRYPQGLPPGADQSTIDAYNEYLAVQSEAQAQAAALTQEYGSLAAAQDVVNDLQDDYKTILTNTLPGAEAAIQTAINLFNEYERSEKTAADFIKLRDGIAGVVADLPNYATQALEAQAATDAAAQAAADYQKALADLRTDIDLTTVAIGEYLAAWNPGREQGNAFIEDARQIEDALNRIRQISEGGATDSPFFLDPATFEQLNAQIMEIQTNTDAGAGRVREWADQLTEAFLNQKISATEYANGIAELTERQAEFAAEVAIMAWELANSALSADETARAMGMLALNIGEGNDALAKADLGIRDLNYSMLSFIPNIYAVATAWASLHGEVSRVQQLNFEGELTDTRSALRPYADALYETAQATTELAERTQDVPPALSSVETAARSQVDVWGQYEDALAGVADQFGLLSTNARLFQAAGIESPSLDVAVNLQGGGDALDRVFGTIVGQTNAMSQQLGSVDSWADKLIGDRGTWSELDQLLTDHRIDIDQYRAAQDAQERITRDVTNAQQDLLAVQAMLAPTIADATRRQAEYIDGLQDLDTESQLAALGFMDQAQSARALEIAQLAAASATDAQKAATTTMIQEMVNADPVLAAMLEKMGLISIGADGQITVNFEDAVTATDAIQDLNDSIDVLIDLLAQAFGIDIDSTDVGIARRELDDLNRLIAQGPPSMPTPELGFDETVSDLQYVATMVSELPFTHTIDLEALDNATAPAETAKGSVENIPESWFTDIDAEDNASGPAKDAKLNLDAIPRSVTTFITAIDNASFTADAVARALDNLDGRSVTTYVNTVQTGSLSLNNPFAATGATFLPEMPATTLPLPSYAGGGTHAVVGEYGPELVWMPYGAQVTPAGASDSRMQAMAASGGGRTNVYGSVNIYPESGDLHTALSSSAIRRGRW